MTPFALRCRVCEEVTAPEPLDACRRCDGPTDVTYDWDRVARLVTRDAIAAGPPSLWRYHDLLPAGAQIEHGSGRTPLTPAAQLSESLGIDLRLKLEDANPTRSYKDRVATLAASAGLDHGVTTLCCSSTGNLGDAVAARHPGARVFAVDGTYDDCRRLELELGALFPWGFVSGNLHPYASEGAKTISFEIAEQLGWRLPDAVVCPAASGTLFSKLARGFSEVVRAGLTDGPLPRLFAGQAEGSSPIADAFAGVRGISRVEADTEFASLAVGDPSYGDLAIGAARATGGRIVAVRGEDIRKNTALLASTNGVAPDASGGAALGALVDAVQRGEVRPGELVVLVVTGARPEPAEGVASRVTTVRPEADAVLTALGLRS